MTRRMAGVAVALAMITALFARTSATSAHQMMATECFNTPGITNCLEGKFLDYWRANGGLPVFGYPITAAADEANKDTGKTYLTQWLERNRLEIHPENAGTPYEILLGLLGKDRLAQLGRNPGAEARESGPKAGCLWFAETGHNVCNQSGNLGFKTYWESNGLKIAGLDNYARSLQLFGLPLTEPKTETNANGDTVLTQWFERARFEWHPNNPDNFKVLLGLLGKEVRGNQNPNPTPSPTPTPPPTSNACADAPAPVSARVRPSNCDVEGTLFEMDFFGFQPNEEVGLWLTAPDGEIVGTRTTVNIGPSGRLSGFPFPTEAGDAGTWQWTMQGTTSQHLSVVYVKVLPKTAGGKRCSGTLPAPQNGTIAPACVNGPTTVTITGRGFTPGEEIGYYATEPSQAVYDLSEIFDEKLYADDEGTFGIQIGFTGRGLEPGAYAFTFEGTQSGNKTIVYFEGAF
ncbi:MAG TPA: hypothetical protein VGE07_14210 [Herpetosiphonaceae bacterium]